MIVNRQAIETPENLSSDKSYSPPGVAALVSKGMTF